MQERLVKLIRCSRGQFIQIPPEFHLPGDDAVMRKQGGRLIIDPVPPVSLLAILADLQPIAEDFPAIDDPPPGPVRI